MTREEHILEWNCPSCGHEVRIIGCSTCKFRKRNYFKYEQAKKCWSCDMLHKNYIYDEKLLKKGKIRKGFSKLGERFK